MSLTVTFTLITDDFLHRGIKQSALAIPLKRRRRAHHHCHHHHQAELIFLHTQYKHRFEVKT